MEAPIIFLSHEGVRGVLVAGCAPCTYTEALVTGPDRFCVALRPVIVEGVVLAVVADMLHVWLCVYLYVLVYLTCFRTINDIEYVVPWVCS